MSALAEEEALGKVYDTQLLKRLWPFVRPYSGWIVLSLVLIPVRALLELLPPLFIGSALDYLLTGEITTAVSWLAPLIEPPADMPMLIWCFVVATTLAIALLGLEWLRTYSMVVLGQRTVHDLRRWLFDHTQRLPMGFFDRYPVGRLVTRLTNDMENLAEMFSMGVVALVADLFLMAAFAWMLFAIDARLALGAMLVVPFLVVAAVVFRYKVRQAFREVRVKIARINAQLQETISGIRVVQLFAREKRNLEDFAKENASHRDSWFRSINYDALLFSSVDLATNLTRASVFWFGARLLGAEEISLGTVFVFTDYMTRFFRPLLDLSAKYSVMQSSMASAERVFQLFDEPAESGNQQAAGEPSDRSLRAVASSGSGPRIEFRNVSFSYGREVVLEDVSFVVESGERVALVGATGSGKTTTLKLLARLYEQQEGQILVDGVDHRELPRSELRRRMAFVLQDVFLFEGSLRENVVLGRDVEGGALKSALETSHVTDMVDGLEQGLDEPVSERGSNFSAGERQLLSFARALAGRPDLLLLDEATSSVDTETEARIQDALSSLMQDRTALVVAHRLSTIRDVDRIYVFQRGRICEQGSHDELMVLQGMYWRLYQLQYAQQNDAA